MPFRLTKRLEPTGDGFVIRLTREEVDAMGVEPEGPVDIEVWPGSLGFERIPV